MVIVTDYGGRIEELKLLSQSTGSVRDVLLSHNGNATAIMENVWWKGMLLLPYANRIAYVSVFTQAVCISRDSCIRLLGHANH